MSFRKIHCKISPLTLFFSLTSILKVWCFFTKLRERKTGENFEGQRRPTPSKIRDNPFILSSFFFPPAFLVLLPFLIFFTPLFHFYGWKQLRSRKR
uniref:Uncharacterized protein n=1 Tax=Arundo donax TaxID=35708 RepID=A0A0A9HXR9_ARUDO